MTPKARVKAGRLVLDEPTDLPEGTEVELLPSIPATRSTTRHARPFTILCSHPRKT